MTKEELHAALDLYAKIQRLKAQLNDLRQSLGKPPEVRVQGGAGVSTAMIAADLSTEVAGLEDDLKTERVVIQRHLDKCPFSDVERKLMILRYVKCYSWKEVETALCYTRRWVFTLHTAALNKALEST